MACSFLKAPNGSSDGGESAKHSLMLPKTDYIFFHEDGVSERSPKHQKLPHTMQCSSALPSRFQKPTQTTLHVFGELSKTQPYGVTWAVLRPSSI